MIGVRDITRIGIMRNDDDSSFVRICFWEASLDFVLVPVIQQRSQNQVITVKNDIDQFLTFFLVIICAGIEQTYQKILTGAKCISSFHSNVQKLTFCLKFKLC